MQRLELSIKQGKQKTKEQATSCSKSVLPESLYTVTAVLLLLS